MHQMQHYCTAWAAGMDNVRNMTGSPIAGIDPHEFIDSRPLTRGMLPLTVEKPVGTVFYKHSTY